MNGLETVFSAGHEYYTRIFYDRFEGSYYDLSTDLFLTLEECRLFGLPV